MAEIESTIADFARIHHQICDPSCRRSAAREIEGSIGRPGYQAPMAPRATGYTHFTVWLRKGGRRYTQNPEMLATILLVECCLWCKSPYGRCWQHRPSSS